MAGMLTDLAVAVRLASRTSARRFKGDIETTPSLDKFSASLQKLLERADSGTLCRQPGIQTFSC